MFSKFSAIISSWQVDGLSPWAALLDNERINRAFAQAREDDPDDGGPIKGPLYTPAMTLWIFLSQCLSANGSCREAVARLVSWRLAAGQSPCSAGTGAYCTARDHLPEAMVAQLVRDTARESEQAAEESWRWTDQAGCARRALFVDGSTVTLADTPKNQLEYPQPPQQKSGCGFPIARIVTLFSLATGAVVEAAIGASRGKLTAENALFRSLHGSLNAGDVIVADRFFSGYYDLALLAERGVEFVVHKHFNRKTDFRTGRRLGRDDHMIRWSGNKRPDWLSDEQYARLPKSFELREVRIRVENKGFRTKVVIVVTSLLDSELVTRDDIAELYRRRWEAELNLRSLKTSLGMDFLRCKTPHRCRVEWWTYLLAYNLIRETMGEAARRSETSDAASGRGGSGRDGGSDRSLLPHEVSFAGTVQTLTTMLPMIGTGVNQGAANVEPWLTAMFTAILSHRVSDRPGRYEPRHVKRRPKAYPRLTEPRQKARKKLAA